MPTYAHATSFSSRGHLSQSDLERFAAAFRKCASNEGELTRDNFAKMVSAKNVRGCNTAMRYRERVRRERERERE